jgi:SP family sugar:H+ symporter-like MFS transporter
MCCHGSLSTDGYQLYLLLRHSILQEQRNPKPIPYRTNYQFGQCGFDNSGSNSCRKMGRRPLLLFGAVGMCACEFIIAIVGVTATSEIANKVLIAYVCFYIFFFACSWDPVGWVVVGEIFPLKLRAKSMACSIASNWIFNWAIAYATPYLVDDGPGNARLGAKVFFVWGTCSFFCALFVYFFVYGTKG